ncbi:DUF1073 domain-containing protein [Novosphingobium sp. FSY-8]|uniref:Anti-CBASS protein Acb1 n=2 Tax=Novosphingobium ovatum TaxID=1908523 RepID=A0ABW9XFZ8_9SPHN|nr:DUF1073 domain-containing protein [Novosphingobium ovatum]
MRKIITIPALDMIREGRCWEMERDQIEALEAEEKRHGLAQKLLAAEVLRALGGGALVLGLPGLPQDPAPATVSKGGLAFVNVVSRWHLSFTELADDPTKPGFGQPAMWRMNTAKRGQITIHPSRVIPFRADTTAALASSSVAGMADQYWGESTVEQVLDAVRDSDTARASFAALLHKARLTRIGIPGLSELVSTPDGENAMAARLKTMAMAESIYNMAIYDAGGPDMPGEAITDVVYNFAGAKDVLNAYNEFACAISDIPATRLLGRAPEGMNSSGDSQQKDWSKKIRAKQTLELGPCLDNLDRYLVPSALGSVPDKVDYDFAPLEMPDEDKAATRFKTTADALNVVANLHAMPDQAFAQAAQNAIVEGGWMPGLGQALDGIPEAQRFGITSPPAAANPPALGPDGTPLTDAAPRSLYVSRPVLNRADLQRWATEQGLGELQPDLHVTIAASRAPVDWMTISEEWSQADDGSLTIPPGGVRIVEPLGNRTAVLLFTSSRLSWRHEQIREAGASWDFEAYQPHVSLTGAPVDLAGVEPYRGPIKLGPEVFAEFNGGGD